MQQSGTRTKTGTGDAKLQGTCLNQQGEFDGCQLERQIAHPPSSACFQKTTISSACKKYLRNLSLDLTVFLTGFINVSSVTLNICLCSRNREINLSHLIVAYPVISAKIITKKTVIKTHASTRHSAMPTCNPSMQEAEARGSHIGDQRGLHIHFRAGVDPIRQILFHQRKQVRYCAFSLSMDFENIFKLLDMKKLE